MKLYEIKQELDDLLAVIEEADGELSADEEGQLERIYTDREAKAEACARWMLNQEALIKARKEEIKRLQDLNKSAERGIENLTHYMVRNLGPEFQAQSALGRIYFKHTVRTEVLDEDLISEEYRNYKTSWTPMKAEAKKAFEAGHCPAGFKFVDNFTLSLGKGSGK